MKDIFTLADELKSLKDRKADLKDELSLVETDITDTEQRLIQRMGEEETSSFVRSGFKYYMSTRVFASPAAAEKYTLYSWLKENGYGDLVQETVHSNTLSSWVKEFINENGELPDDLKSLVNVFEKVQINIRKGN